MFSTLSTIQSINSKPNKVIIPVPDAPILFNFNTAYQSSSTIFNAGTIGNSISISMRNPSSVATTLMLSTASKEGSHCIIGWVNPNLYHTETLTNSFSCYIYNCSFSYWVTGGDTNFATCFSIGIGTTSNLYHQCNGATAMNIYYNGSNLNGTNALTTAILSATFTHCVITITTGGFVSAYVNKVLVGTVQATPLTTLQTNINHFRMLNNTRAWGGKLDCFRIYDKVLSTGEIEAIYNAGV
jgi:hypothetical protein